MPVKRHPQYVLLLDLLMLVLFVLLSIPSDTRIQYTFTGRNLPPDSYLIVENPPVPTRHYDFEALHWVVSRGVIDPGKTLFAECQNLSDCPGIVEELSLPEGKIKIGMSGTLAKDLKAYIFDVCGKYGKCEGLTINVNEDGEISADL